MIDYQDLLKRYIHLVLSQESFDYIDYAFFDGTYPIFTPEEINELEDLSDEPATVEKATK